MKILIIGGSKSGKSSFGEDKVMELSSEGDRYYLATMKVYGNEGKEIVKRHQNLRKGKGFITIEKETNVSEIISENNLSDATVMLECLSNLVANEMFETDALQDADYVSDKVYKDVVMLGKACKNLVIVTNNIFEDGCDYDSSTVSYINSLGTLNVKLADYFDEVYEVVCGIPIRL